VFLPSPFARHRRHNKTARSGSSDGERRGGPQTAQQPLSPKVMSGQDGGRKAEALTQAPSAAAG